MESALTSEKQRAILQLAGTTDSEFIEEAVMDELVIDGLVFKRDGGEFELTDAGKAMAVQIAQAVDTGRNERNI